jgi:6-phosphogluconate dehydrogenase
MLPPGKATDSGIAMVLSGLDRGDLVIDGGNSDFRDAGRRGALLRSAGCRFMDVGVSGGVWGHINGYGITAGGEDADFAAVAPLLSSLAADGLPFHVGPVGAGHFAKMVHNAVEYAVMQAYAEGFELLTASELDVDVAKTFAAWQTGCSIRSWLLGQLVVALSANPSLAGIPARAGDSGMGRWAVEESVRLGVPIPGIAAAVFARFGSQRADSPGMQAVAALRQQVGGHVAPSAPRDGVLP